MKHKKAIALFSGGLDSVLTVKFMESLGYLVIPVFFATPFFGAEKALAAGRKYKIDVHIEDITEDHLEILKDPVYGYGKYTNPCIDCHALMFKKAGELLKKFEADFLISGEVLGQRPMSQRKDALNAVKNLSGIKDLIIRPLSQKILPDTLPVREGWVNKEDMLDINGRSRKRQMELAERFGIGGEFHSGGGCLLTEKGFSLKVKDLLENDMLTTVNAKMLNCGRHFRINNQIKLILGKTSVDNELLSGLITDEVVLKAAECKGPIGVIISKAKPGIDDIKTCAAIVLQFTSKALNPGKVRFGKNFELAEAVTVSKLSKEIIEDYRIN